MNIEITKCSDPPFVTNGQRVFNMYKLQVMFSMCVDKAEVRVVDNWLFNNVSGQWETSIVRRCEDKTGEWFLYPEQTTWRRKSNKIQVIVTIGDTNTITTQQFKMTLQCECDCFQLQQPAQALSIFGLFRNELPVMDATSDLSQLAIGLPVSNVDELSHSYGSDVMVDDISPRTINMLENGEIMPPPLRRQVNEVSWFEPSSSSSSSSSS